MKLICMAHRAEAQVFIKGLKLDFIESNLYKSQDTFLMITGEGAFEVLTKLPYIISKYNITSIINIGIAGSLDKSLELNKVYSIRTLYSFIDQKPQFKSYTTNGDSKLDCITTFERVLNHEFSQKLSCFSQIVDREAWAVARVANEYKLEFYCYKLISDFAGAETNCFDLKERALEFSQKMFDFYKRLEFRPQTSYEAEAELPFFASFSQQKKVSSLVEKLNLSKESFKEITDSLHNKSGQADKVTTNSLINLLESKLDPVNKVVDQEFDSLFRPLKKIGAHLSYNKRKDTKKISLKMEINSQKNIENLIRELNKLDFSRIEKVWNGDFSV